MEKTSAHSEQTSTPPKHQQILYNQIIDEQQPGTILRDFEVLVAFVKEHASLKVTNSNNLLPMNMLPQLNEAMSHPIKLALKRPQHKSFPNILGLYLLLRATGIACIEGSGTEQRLIIDEEILESWQTLNPTERYFMLLETALLRAERVIIGEYVGGLWENPLYLWGDFLKRIPEGGMDIAGNNRDEDMLKTIPGFYNLALMRMFELVTILEDEPEQGKGWRILSIHPTPLGEAIFQELSDVAPSFEYTRWIDEEEKQVPGFGELQLKFQPFFQEWQHNLVIPEHQVQEGIYIFKVTVWKNVWRRVVVPGYMVLDRLSEIILESFNFDNDHLYRFIYTDRFGINHNLDHPILHEGGRSDSHVPFTNEVTVQEVPLRPGRSMVFFFDFGDCWEFEVLLEDIAAVEPALKKPNITEKRGRAPKQYGY